MDWYCEHCGATFGEDEFRDCCPECGSNLVDECERCDWCYDWKNPETLVEFPFNGRTSICPDCFGQYEGKYRERFLKLPMNDPDRPGDTWDDYFKELMGVPVFKIHTFRDFIAWDDEANVVFYHFCKREMIRDAARRGRAANVKVNYSEVRK